MIGEAFRDRSVNRQKAQHTPIAASRWIAQDRTQQRNCEQAFLLALTTFWHMGAGSAANSKIVGTGGSLRRHGGVRKSSGKQQLRGGGPTFSHFARDGKQAR